jgi:fermentation-respiration switch protein FrsA (DUF1100 family)
VKRRVAGVVLQAPFTSIPDRAQELYPCVPARLLTLDRFDNLGRIAAIGAPLLIVHGTEDRIVPAEHGRKLLDATHEPKRGVFIPNADGSRSRSASVSLPQHRFAMLQRLQLLTGEAGSPQAAITPTPNPAPDGVFFTTPEILPRLEIEPLSRRVEALERGQQGRKPRSGPS